jgi:hypothetical protein
MRDVVTVVERMSKKCGVLGCEAVCLDAQGLFQHVFRSDFRDRHAHVFGSDILWDG